MVKLNKEYSFNGPNGKVKLADLFEGRKQLILYHFMLAPEDKAGCTGCSFVVDNLPSSLTHLHSRDTTLALVSRAPFPSIEKFKTRMGWSFPWYSVFGSEFNSDFKVVEEGVFDRPAKGEDPGLAVFFRDGDDIYHTYSTYYRGVERLLVTYRLLDVTPLGRQETKAMDWKLHDEY